MTIAISGHRDLGQSSLKISQRVLSQALKNVGPKRGPIFDTYKVVPSEKSAI